MNLTKALRSGGQQPLVTTTTIIHWSIEYVWRWDGQDNIRHPFLCKFIHTLQIASHQLLLLQTTAVELDYYVVVVVVVVGTLVYYLLHRTVMLPVRHASIFTATSSSLIIVTQGNDCPYRTGGNKVAILFLCLPFYYYSPGEYNNNRYTQEGTCLYLHQGQGRDLSSVMTTTSYEY